MLQKPNGCRDGNQLAAADGAESALAFSSGMAATSTALMALLSAGG